jgi:hypothetical protein
MENKLKTKDKRQKKQDKRKSPLGRGLGWVYNAEVIGD